jgi:hypothetical protein
VDCGLILTEYRLGSLGGRKGESDERDRGTVLAHCLYRWLRGVARDRAREYLGEPIFQVVGKKRLRDAGGSRDEKEDGEKVRSVLREIKSKAEPLRTLPFMQADLLQAAPIEHSQPTSRVLGNIFQQATVISLVF